MLERTPQTPYFCGSCHNKEYYASVKDGGQKGYYKNCILPRWTAHAQQQTRELSPRLHWKADIPAHEANWSGPWHCKSRGEKIREHKQK